MHKNVSVIEVFREDFRHCNGGERAQEREHEDKWIGVVSRDSHRIGIPEAIPQKPQETRKFMVRIRPVEAFRSSCTIATGQRYSNRISVFARTADLLARGRRARLSDCVSYPTKPTRSIVRGLRKSTAMQFPLSPPHNALFPLRKASTRSPSRNL